MCSVLFCKCSCKFPSSCRRSFVCLVQSCLLVAYVTFVAYVHQCSCGSWQPGQWATQTMSSQYRPRQNEPARSSILGHWVDEDHTTRATKMQHGFHINDWAMYPRQDRYVPAVRDLGFLHWVLRRCCAFFGKP